MDLFVVEVVDDRSENKDERDEVEVYIEYSGVPKVNNS
jgi:hypothetical protein